MTLLTPPSLSGRLNVTATFGSAESSVSLEEGQAEPMLGRMALTCQTERGKRRVKVGLGQKLG